MIVPKSLKEWDALTERQKSKFVEYETNGNGGPGCGGYLIYDQWDLIINYTRSRSGKLISMTAETINQAKQRVIMMVLARQAMASTMN